MSFIQYLEEMNHQQQLRQMAEDLASMGIDPREFLVEFAMENDLVDTKVYNELMQGLGKTIGAIPGAIGGGIKNFFTGLAQGPSAGYNWTQGTGQQSGAEQQPDGSGGEVPTENPQVSAGQALRYGYSMLNQAAKGFAAQAAKGRSRSGADYGPVVKAMQTSLNNIKTAWDNRKQAPTAPSTKPAPAAVAPTAGGGPITQIRARRGY